MSRKPAATPKRKKPYRAPVIQVYGNVRTLTQAVGTTGSADGGMSANMNKTR